MAIVPTNFADGTVMTRAAVEAELDRARKWVNGAGTHMFVGDFVQPCVERAHLWPPETLGYPLDRSEGPTQQLYDRQRGWENHHRHSIFGGMLDQDESCPVPTAGASVYSLVGGESVELACEFRALAFTDFTAGPVYPANAGRFDLVVRKRTGGSKLKIPGTKRVAPCAYWSAASNNKHDHGAFTTVAQYTLSSGGGVYDFWLDYDADGAAWDATGIRQVVVYARSLTLSLL